MFDVYLWESWGDAVRAGIENLPSGWLMSGVCFLRFIGYSTSLQYVLVFG